VKTPVVNQNSKVLMPGQTGHKAPIKLTPNEAEKRKKEASTTEVRLCKMLKFYHPRIQLRYFLN